MNIGWYGEQHVIYMDSSIIYRVYRLHINGFQNICIVNIIHRLQLPCKQIHVNSLLAVCCLLSHLQCILLLYVTALPQEFKELDVRFFRNRWMIKGEEILNGRDNVSMCMKTPKVLVNKIYENPWQVLVKMQKSLKLQWLSAIILLIMCINLLAMPWI